ncbi:hypothetical protein GX50_08051 [[Emmonsia] crescens]|uniref:DUF7582 domain-containing protein n=1 Tax=[Emmonsia] crescens TaxID=73230 RepID=A0A2B7Z5N1_9EURO|nr:hypothetical protein GX50_08051 [Emmonsia crescens]
MATNKQEDNRAESTRQDTLVLDKAKMERGLVALDEAMGKDLMIHAFSPITMISPGGYIAVTYFENRISTEDIDVIIDPDYAGERDLLNLLRTTMMDVGDYLGYGKKWINDSVALFLTTPSRRSLFDDAKKQDIVLWSGENLRVLAAPLEWGLESKLRRLSAKPNHPKRVTDMSDVLVLLNALINKNKGALNRDVVLGMNRNGFDLAIKEQVLDQVAEEYEGQYGEKPFC